MIVKLRRKFILILMSVVSLILLLVFLSMLLSTWNNTKNMSENMLRQAIAMAHATQGMPPRGGEWAGGPDILPPKGRLPVLVAELDPNGNIIILDNQLYYMEGEEVAAAVDAALREKRLGGILTKSNLRYLKSQDDSCVALTDASFEQEILNRLVLHCLLIGTGALLAFFFVSLHLSRWAVRPVELSWQRQRQFVADASHELKTPLTVILSNAEMLKGGRDSNQETDARRLEHIHAEALRMKGLVESLLTLAKADSLEEARVFAPVNFSLLLTKSLLTFEPLVYDEGKTLTWKAEENLTVSGDEERLGQLVSILLDNARKYAKPTGTIAVTLRVGERGSLLLTVFNQGDPIPKEELQQIFLRFYRVDKARSGEGSFGLGLSIARIIVSDYGGKIWAESGEEGNSFHITLPLKSHDG